MAGAARFCTSQMSAESKHVDSAEPLFSGVTSPHAVVGDLRIRDPKRPGETKAGFVAGPSLARPAISSVSLELHFAVDHARRCVDLGLHTDVDIGIRIRGILQVAGA